MGRWVVTGELMIMCQVYWPNFKPPAIRISYNRKFDMISKEEERQRHGKGSPQSYQSPLGILRTLS